jgi:hypothetical protein
LQPIWPVYGLLPYDLGRERRATPGIGESLRPKTGTERETRASGLKQFYHTKAQLEL